MSTPSEIARYSMTYIAGQGIPASLDPQGVWVKHTDHLAARADDAAEIERLRAENAELKRDIAAKAEAAAKEIAEFEYDNYGTRSSPDTVAAIITRIFEGRSEC